MRAILATLALGGLLALMALPAALGRPATGPPAFTATLRATSKTTKVVTVKNLGPSTIVEVFVFPLKGFSIVDVKSVRGPSSAGASRGCTKKKSAGKIEVGCKTSLRPGKSTSITLETKQEGSGPVLAIVAIKDSNGQENQKNVPER